MDASSILERVARALATSRLAEPRVDVSMLLAAGGRRRKASRFEMTPAKFERFLKEGRGRGAGPTYRPWIQVSDLSSKGRVHRTASALTGFRTHHLLSDNEYSAYLRAWWDENVLDIREQYPLLPVGLTESIAESLGVKHPWSNKYQFAIPQTSDLFLVRGGGIEVVAVKEDEDYEKPRTKEKLAIAEEFWRRRNVPTRVALSSELKTARFWNLEWIYDARLKPADLPFRQGRSRLYDWLVSVVVGGEISSRELGYRADVAMGLPRGTGIEAIRRLLAERVLSTDIDAGDISKDCGLCVGSVVR
ncbi:transposase [Cupriavidus taiwanensis]|uniref:TnsA endonuclease N-terminal domain-containing protein n=1 Tax=Cupriavidus taiwanensis TaxID=164546 RepID=UPI000E14D48E|nr:TnsA endonuclease N-terminal domain-containing protein [Cupriavidus taiwanensis]SOY93246.1 transposase [Cupriavidus taiwanensis]SOY96507.1 transposase [Cupriavidus taiwanensis]